MKVAITGSAGFIGSNLVEGCLRKGWTVVGIDNLSTGFDEMADPTRVMELPGHYMFLKLDITETSSLAQAFVDCEIVFHLAALPRVSFSIDKPMAADFANIHGTLSVLEAARQAKVKRVIFSCSSSVYGGVAQFPTPETALPSPKSPYALHKQTGAEYCRLYSELHGLETVSLLYFNVFGPLQRSGGAYSTVIPAFFEAATKGISCRIDGDGLQSRDLCYVDNVVQANIQAAVNAKRFSGDRFNIACGETHSVLDIYEQVKILANSDLQKYHVDTRKGDPRKSHAKIEKAREILGYDPKIDFYTGMRLTWEWWNNGCQI